MGDISSQLRQLGEIVLQSEKQITEANGARDLAAKRIVELMGDQKSVAVDVSDSETMVISRTWSVFGGSLFVTKVARIPLIAIHGKPSASGSKSRLNGS